jgi:hypothetical protein
MILLTTEELSQMSANAVWSFFLEIPSRLGENYFTDGELALLMEWQLGESVEVRIVS